MSLIGKKNEKPKLQLMLAAPEGRPSLDKTLADIGITVVKGTEGKGIQFEDRGRALVTVETFGDYLAITSQDFDGQKPLVAFPTGVVRRGGDKEIASSVADFNLYMAAENRKATRDFLKKAELEQIELNKSGLAREQFIGAIEIARVVKSKIDNVRKHGGGIPVTVEVETLAKEKGVPIPYANFMMKQIMQKLGPTEAEIESKKRVAEEKEKFKKVVNDALGKAEHEILLPRQQVALQLESTNSGSVILLTETMPERGVVRPMAENIRSRIGKKVVE